MAASRKRTIDPAAKRRAILAAAERLFAEQGYSATSTTAIAAAADVAVGTLFRHFADKATLLAALHERLELRFADAMSAAWDEARDVPAIDRLEPMFEALFDVAAAEHRLLPVLGLAVTVPLPDTPAPGTLMRARIERQYREAVAAGEFRALPPAAAARIVHGMVEGALAHWMSDPSRARADAFDTLLALARTAFAPGR